MSHHIYPYERAKQALAVHDFALALSLAQPYADKGDPAAQCDLGFLYQMGLVNGTQDFCEALNWYTRAAAQDHAIAWNNMGTIYSTGSSDTPIDLAKALSCYEKAHELGFSAMHLEELRSRLG
jgi:uncharacterized protein